ncbi:MAG: hypothetical protein K2X81_12905 [Candidatus Obscuribacterales bacterium]|nr:hypothetical protein [Candidatus Obscuribacterales bacterium]
MDWKDALKSPWALAALLLLGTAGGRKMVKSASKEVIRAGLVVSDKVKELVAEVKEETDDLVAEVQAERKSQGKHITSKAAS